MGFTQFLNLSLLSYTTTQLNLGREEGKRNARNITRRERKRERKKQREPGERKIEKER